MRERRTCNVSKAFPAGVTEQKHNIIVFMLFYITIILKSLQQVSNTHVTLVLPSHDTKMT